MSLESTPARSASRRVAAWRCLLTFAALLGAGAAHAQFTSEPVRTATIGQPYAYEVVTIGGYEVTAPNGLPAWLALAARPDGTATLSGTAVGPPGPVAVYLRAESFICLLFSACPAQSFTINVATPPNQPPAVVPPGIPDQTLNEEQTLSLNVTSAFSDPEGNALTFSAAGLPAGFSISAGVISGFATSTTAQGSPYTVTVTANDGNGGVVSDAFQLSVVPIARADLSVSSFVASPSPAPLNAAVSWTITVANAGPSPSGSVELAVTFGGASLTFTPGACTVTAAPSGQQRVVCTISPIAANATQVVTLSASGAQAGDVYATAVLDTAAASPRDPNANNNRAVASVNLAQSIVAEAAQAIGAGGNTSTAADLNKDGFSDLAVAPSGDEPGVLLSIDNPTVLNPALAGTKRRGLASVPLQFGTSAAAKDIAAADFDGDQHLDVVIANGPGTASRVYRNDGTGVFTQIATLGDAGRDDRAVAVADMNGDGRPDIVIGSAGSNTLYVNQNGTAFAPTALPAAGGSGAVDVALGDVSGSTLPDLILVNANGTVVRHENLGTSFAAAAAVDPGPVVVAAAGDFNRDGKADLLLGRIAPNASGLPTKTVHLSNGAGGFAAGPVLGATPTRGLALGDVDRDGLVDFVSINVTGTHQLYRGDGSGGFALQPTVVVAAGATAGTIASIATSGASARADLVLTAPATTFVFFGDGRGGFGLGDTTRPVIQLIGPPEVVFEAGGTYTDPGATATDDVDGALTPLVTNPVDAGVVGTYTVTYNVSDSSGNAATPVTRTVRVTAKSQGGGGGGAIEWWSVLALLAAGAAARVLRRSSLEVVERRAAAN